MKNYRLILVFEGRGLEGADFPGFQTGATAEMEILKVNNPITAQEVCSDWRREAANCSRRKPGD